ncbi:hypothetical protein ACODNH_19870 (plasmid) [Haloarcula sp. NS06]|uniref:hypothetical protein n=1 Tax=Haloarcula sp. NS06 TaxID=3409688 RepID=UPI003DA6D8C0
MPVGTWVRRWGREGLIVVGAFVALLVTTPVLVTAGSVAWEQGTLYAIASAFNGLLPGNLDVPVAIGVGVCSGLLLLFFADSTKRIQTGILVVVGSTVIGLLQRFDHILGAVRERPVVFGAVTVVTVIVGVVTTIRVGGNNRPRRMDLIAMLRWIQFPAATQGLFVILSGLVLLQVIEYPFLDHGPGAPSSPVVVVSGVGALISLGLFVQYRSQKNIVTITPDGEPGRLAMGYGLGGLYKYARKNYHASVIGGNNRSNFKKLAENPAFEQVNFSGTVSFKYLPSSLLNRSIVVHSRGFTLSDIGSNLPKVSGGRLGRLKTISANYLARSVPDVIWTKFGRNDAVSHLKRADTALIILPLPNKDDEPPFDVEAVDRLVSLLETQTATDVVILCTGARDSLEGGCASLDNHEQIGAKLYNIAFNHLGADDPELDIELNDHADDIYPVDRGDSDEHATGFKAVLRAL